MRLVFRLLVLLLALAAFAAIPWRKASHSEPPPRPHTWAAEVSPVCPWREPERDLLALFPTATNYVTETCVLSSVTSELRKRLGRQMNSDENPLRIYRVRKEGQCVGSILVTRVKAEHGGVEIVTGIEPGGAVHGVLIQSQREPEPIAEVIASAAFRAAFVGKGAAAPLRLGDDLPEVPAVARPSAQSIADGVHSQLIVLSFAEVLLANADPGLQHAR